MYSANRFGVFTAFGVSRRGILDMRASLPSYGTTIATGLSRSDSIPKPRIAQRILGTLASSNAVTPKALNKSMTDGGSQSQTYRSSIGTTYFSQMRRYSSLNDSCW